MNDRKQKMLYALQEEVFNKLQSMRGSQFDAAKFCGGTALSRCWLEHRLSYDLDFFMPHGFRAIELLSDMKNCGIQYDLKDIVDDHTKANQLHGFVKTNGQWLKVSFVEDSYFSVFKETSRPFGALTVRTESIDGLYHRKLRTVSGSAMDGDAVVGGRQKARDLFDLFVLSKHVSPLPEFISSLPYSFPVDAFINGLSSIPWLDVCHELSEIDCAPSWIDGKDVQILRDTLYLQMQISTVDAENAWQLPENQPVLRKKP